MKAPGYLVVLEANPERPGYMVTLYDPPAYVHWYYREVSTAQFLVVERFRDYDEAFAFACDYVVDVHVDEE